MAWTRIRPYMLVALLTGAGVTHFVRPGFYDPMVPHVLPGSARAWTYASGAAEIAVAVAVARPRTRTRGALAALALFVAVYPANLQMAADADTLKERAIAYGRLPLQFPLFWLAWKVSRAADRTASPDRVQ
ncbi:MAG: hypothetical protein ABIO67_01705 [Mycobacteriales bacterium]